MRHEYWKIRTINLWRILEWGWDENIYPFPPIPTLVMPPQETYIEHGRVRFGKIRCDSILGMVFTHSNFLEV